MNPIKPDVLKSFGLKLDPFSTVVLDGHFYHTPEFQKAIRMIEYAIDHFEVIAMVGDVGTGKTEVLREVRLHFAGETERKGEFVTLAHLDKKTIRIGSVVDAFLAALQVNFASNTSQQKRTLMMRHALAKAHSDGRRFCLLVDEAHRVNGDFLKSLKELHEQSRYAGRHALFAVVLLGDETLIEIYQRIARDVWERLDASNIVHFSKLSPLEVEKYIEHRVHAVGGNGLFDAEARKAVGLMVQEGGGATHTDVNKFVWNILNEAYRLGVAKIGKTEILRIFDRGKLLKSLGLSYEEAGRRGGIGKSTVADVVKGSAGSKSVEAVEKVIADALGGT